MACLIEFYQRAWDSGTGGYVYWSSVAPDPTPLPSETQPNYTGALSLYVILCHIRKEV